MSRPLVFRSLVLAFGLFLAGCSDQGTIAPVEPTSGLIGSLTGGPMDATGLQLQAVWWNRELPNPVSVTRTIDATGGTITIPETGLTVSFPTGAVSAPLAVTITADVRYVAYKMDPAGTQFLKDVTVTQLLSTTTLAGKPLSATLYAAYIANDSVSLSGNVPAIEIEPSATIFSALSPLIPQAQVWIIRHFSRYMLASG